MRKVLVANRGEPVIRAVKTLRRMEIATAVVFAPEDAAADWLAEVDFAYPLAERSMFVGKSAYLDGEQIVEIARARGCDAVWPGWGFLAENVEFAEAVINAGLAWIGPPPAAMRALGSKEDSGVLARTAGVPTIPETVIGPRASCFVPRENLEQDVPKHEARSTEHEQFASIGFPLLLKPALGGGGQGQAIVRTPDELAAAFAAVARINAAQFNNGPILAQRYIENARHIEAQVLADTHGTIIVFHERECSVQRRNQKIIEESPSPALTPELRAELQSYAHRLAAAAGYASAGTLEFLFTDGRFYFLEMNTRLQVEHPITEETTRWIDSGGRWRRIDLFEEMVRVARGDRLRFAQEAVRLIGHAVEARIYAEDPSRDFLPCPGMVTSLRFPVSDRFRVETALRGPGSLVNPKYDPMLAKLIAWGETRAAALTQLRLGLERTTIGGLITNVPFLHRVTNDADFSSGEYSTGYVAQHPMLCSSALAKGGLAIAVAAIALYDRDRNAVLERITSGKVTNVAAVLGAIPQNGGEYLCTLGGRTVTIEVAEWAPEQYVVTAKSVGRDMWDENTKQCRPTILALTCVRISGDEIVVLLPNGETCAAGLAWQRDVVDVTVDGETYPVGWAAPGTTRKRDPHAAPGGGRLVQIGVTSGQAVRAGDLLYITEAMKMEARVVAAFDGIVEKIHAEPGQGIEAGQTIIEIVPATSNQQPATEVAQTWTHETLNWPNDATPVGRLFEGPVGLGERRLLRAARNIVRRYFHGYDIPREAAEHAVGCIAQFIRSGQEDPVRIADLLANCCRDFRAVAGLFSEGHVHSTVYFIEHVMMQERRVPKDTEALFAALARSAGLPDLRDGRALRYALLHWMQAARYRLQAASEFLLHCFEQLVKPTHCQSPQLTAAVRELIAQRMFPQQPALRARWREVFRDVDWDAFYAIELPPVAREYWDLYEQCLADPLHGIPAGIVAQMRQAAAELDPGLGTRDSGLATAVGPVSRVPGPGSDWSGLTTEASTLLSQWFAGFAVHQLPVSRAAEEAGVALFAVRQQIVPVQRTANAAEEIPWRLIAVACVKSVRPVMDQENVAALPEVERAAIEAYWAIRAYETVGLRGDANEAFLFLPATFCIPNHSTDITRQIAARVGGFARHLRIMATEVVLTLGAARQLIQIWHAREVGILSRPPMALAERLPEAKLVGEKAINLRQQRLGKLLNRDRARLLFDNGEYEELLFPEVDLMDAGLGTRDSGPTAAVSHGSRVTGHESESIGLNVYRGRIDGADVLAYAGDFRHRGGALGEREGKKLAACVVLAYVLQVPLIGIHDGAGANIKGSVASLGWAGAYFGAIAATGGFSSPERFQWWLENHHEREYFEKVLHHFGVFADGTASPVASRRSPVKQQLLATGDWRLATLLPLIHIHLHLGAAVGMLVYGPSISSLAIMVDHPEVYRLLTGAATVERVTGEKGTNYSLGGAAVHGQVSGEIDFTFPSEETAIRSTRELVGVFGDRRAIPSSGVVRRANMPQPETPISAGIIVGREALEANVDDGKFWESRAMLKQAGGLLTGYARLNGQPVVLAVTATDYGMHHGRAFKKMQLAASAAHDFGLPLITVVGANWDRLQPVVRTESIYQQHEMRKAIREATVPKIGIALGPRSLERSVHEMMDLIWYVERGNETAYERERAGILSHGVTDAFATAMDWCADILRYLPRPWELTAVAGRQSPVAGKTLLVGDWRLATGDVYGGRILPTTDPIDRPIPELAGILPKNINQPYDMRAVIARVFDAGSFREFAPADGQPLHTGVATLGGRVVGIIADAPTVEGGAQTVVSISKFTRFHRFCARFGLPIIELNDSPAFRPGREQEQSGIQGEGGKSIREEVLSTIPKIAVTLRQNYGGRYIHANLVTLGPPRRGLIVEGARLGVMGAEGAVGVLFAKELAAIADPKARDRRKAELVADYERTRLNPQQAKDLGYAEAVIPIEQLRCALAKTLQS